MSGRRGRAGAGKAKFVRPKAASASARRRGVRWRSFAAVVMAVVVGLGAFAWFRWPLARPADLPSLPMAGLERAVVDLIERHAADVRANPRSGKAWGTLGGILKSYGFTEPALTCLAEAQRLDPREPRWPYFRGVLETTQSDSKALEHFHRAAGLCGNDPEMPRLRLARLLAETGQADAAQRELEELLRAHPNSGPARLLLAQLRQARGEWGPAMDLASGCVTNPLTARTAWTLLSSLHRRQGDTNAAEQASRRANAAAPDAAWPDPFEEELLAWRKDARSLSDRAQHHLLSGRPEAAMPLIQRLVSEHPNFSETWLLLGRAQYLQNNPAAAEQSLRRLLEMEANSVNGWFQLGMSLLAQRRFEEAALAFQKAITLKTDFGPAYFNLGFALVRSGRLREAVIPFQESLRHNPEKIDSYILLADLHLQLGERDEAVRLAQLAEKLDPTDRRLPALRQKLDR